MTSYKDADTKDLTGLIVDTIDLDDSSSGEHRILITTKCGREFLFHHRQDCCECVEIEDTVGDIKQLEGCKLVECGMVASSRYEKCVHCTETTITFKTNEHTVISRWVGESNGYYSERVDLEEILK